MQRWRGALGALMVLSVLAVPAVTPHDGGHWVGFNLNQQALRPGDDLDVTVWGGDAVLELHRLAPADPDGAGVPMMSRAVVLDGQGSERATFHDVPAGLYRVVVRPFGHEQESGRALVQVTDLGIVLHQGPGGNLAWVLSLADGRPVADALVRVDGAEAGRTGADGTLRLEHVGTLVAEKDGQVAALTGNPWHVPEDEKVWVHVDRPVYRPGQTVHLKAVAWERAGGRYVPAADENVSVRVSVWSHGREQTVFQGHGATGAYGEAVFDVALPEAASIGAYRVFVQSPHGVFHGGFDVEEYRLPDFRLTVAPSDATGIVGDPLDLLVHAERYDGGGVGAAELTYEVVDGYGSPYGGRGMRGIWCDGCGGYRASGTLDLDEDGTARLRLRPDAAGSYRLRVAVEAPTGERVEAEVPLHVASAAFTVQVEAPSTAAPNATVEATVRVVDLAGAPADATATVRAVSEEWLPPRLDEHGAYVSGDWTRRERVLWEGEVPVRGGVGRVAFSGGAGGQVTVTATAKDDDGRAATGQAYVWVQSGAGAPARSMRLEALGPAPRVGEPLALALQAVGPAPVLVVVHDASALLHQVVDPREAGAVRFEDVPATAASAQATALQLAPLRTDAGGLLPELASAQTQVAWRDHPMALDVDVQPDFDVYEDGEAARILVRVRDAAGRPVQAQLSLAMVDQALLDLAGAGASADLAALLYPAAHGSHLASWLHGGSPFWAHRDFLFDADVAFEGAPRVAAMAGAPSATPTPTSAPGGGGGPVPPAVRVREAFPETALWLPQVETGADGVARLEALLPDTLTNWRIVAHAVSQDGRAGSGTGDLQTRKALAADLFAPRFTVAGDTATVQATVSNQIGAMADVHVVLEATGATIEGPAARTLTLAPDATGLVSFTFATPLAGEAVLTLTAWVEDGAADAVRARLPVLPYGVRSGTSEAGRGEAVVEITIPATAAANASRLLVTVSPSTTDAVTQALPFLTGYPYGCVEQTLSTFLPLLAVAEAAAAYGIAKEQIDPALDDQVAAGLDRLYGYQHGSGAWGWWHDDEDNPYTTAYVVYGLALARDAGYDVDADVLARGVAALAQMARASKGEAGPLHAYQVYALSLADPSVVSEVPMGNGSPELAFGILVAQRLGQHEVAAGLAERLVAQAQRSGGIASWSDTGDGWTSHGISSGTMLTAVALRALLAVDPDHEVAHEAARGLLMGRDGRAWGTTKDTAETILSLVDYVQAQGRGDAERTITVDVAGQAHVLRFTRDGAWTAQDPIEVPVGPGTHAVRITQTGDGPLYWSVAGLWFDSAERLAAHTGAFEVQRRIVDDEGRAVEVLRVGEEAFLEVVVRATRDTKYMQVEAPIPAGTEVVDEDEPMFWLMSDFCFRCGGWSAAEVRDEKVGFFEDSFPAGSERTFRVRLRGLLPGEYHVLPAVAEEMYDATARGHSAGASLTVLPKAQLQVGRVDVDGDRVRLEVFPVGLAPDAPLDVAIDAGGQTPPGGVAVERATAQGVPVWYVQGGVADGPFEVRLAAGGARATVRHDPDARAAPPQALFNATHESVWESGPVQHVVSVLREAVAPPVRLPGLVQVPLPDVDEPAKDAARRVPGPALPALAAAILLLAFVRRRLPGGRSGA